MSEYNESEFYALLRDFQTRAGTRMEAVLAGNLMKEMHNRKEREERELAQAELVRKTHAKVAEDAYRLKDGLNEKLATFVLQRTSDVSGVSGTGTVAEGVVFRDGTVAMRWLTETASTCLYQSIEDVEKIHGHNGATMVAFTFAADFGAHLSLDGGENP